MSEKRCQSIMGIAYNEISEIEPAQCELEQGHVGAHVFHYKDRNAILIWND